MMAIVGACIAARLLVEHLLYIPMSLNNRDNFDERATVPEKDDVIAIWQTSYSFHEFRSCSSHCPWQFRQLAALLSQLLRIPDGNLVAPTFPGVIALYLDK